MCWKFFFNGVEAFENDYTKYIIEVKIEYTYFASLYLHFHIKLKR